MSELIEPIARIQQQLARLPGIGSKSALRLAYHIASMPLDQADELASAIAEGRRSIRFCSICGNYTIQEPCPICSNPSRQNGLICVVKDPRDVAAIERMRDYHGVYHVLHGTISPMNGVGPNDIRIPELLTRVEKGHFNEVILATNPDIEGEATANYIAKLLKPYPVTVSRIAHGLPVGGNLEYTDEVTLAKAIEGRRSI
ncbi:MAG: recombination protein RecR [Clostridia bacterium]|nr:recombination protein RecR [Clostridia bacterium]